MGRDELRVLDHELEALDRGGGIHFVGSRIDKDFHRVGQYGCSNLKREKEHDVSEHGKRKQYDYNNPSFLLSIRPKINLPQYPEHRLRQDS